MINSTLALVLLAFKIDTFILVSGIIILTLFVIGGILLYRNVRPITGLMLIIIGLALTIGIAYDYQNIKEELSSFWQKFAD